MARWRCTIPPLSQAEDALSRRDRHAIETALAELAVPDAEPERLMRGRLLEALAYFQSRDGQHDEALALWDEASQLAPQLEDAGFNAGQAAYNLRRYDDALRLWQRALSAKGADLRLQQKIVQALNALARHQEAEEALQALHPLEKRVDGGGPKDDAARQHARLGVVGRLFVGHHVHRLGIESDLDLSELLFAFGRQPGCCLCRESIVCCSYDFRSCSVQTMPNFSFTV